jgi:hypothetical protein
MGAACVCVRRCPCARWCSWASAPRGMAPHAVELGVGTGRRAPKGAGAHLWLACLHGWLLARRRARRGRGGGGGGGCGGGGGGGGGGGLCSPARCGPVAPPCRSTRMRGARVAWQTYDVVKSAIPSLCVYGGMPKGDQKRELRSLRPSVLVATPGRLVDLLNEGPVGAPPPFCGPSCRTAVSLPSAQRIVRRCASRRAASAASAACGVFRLCGRALLCYGRAPATVAVDVRVVPSHAPTPRTAISCRSHTGLHSAEPLRVLHRVLHTGMAVWVGGAWVSVRRQPWTSRG